MSGDALRPSVDADMLGLCGDALAAARPLCTLSQGLALVAGAGVAFAGAFADDVAVALAAWGVALASGLAAQGLAYRIAFDARVFAQLATDAAHGPLDFARFDAAMLRLGLMSAAKAGRDAEARCRGALGLVRALGVAVVVQAVLVMLGGLALASPAS